MIRRTKLKGVLKIYVLWMCAFVAFHLIWLLLTRDIERVADNFVRGALGFSLFMGAVMMISRLLTWFWGRKNRLQINAIRTHFSRILRGVARH